MRRPSEEEQEIQKPAAGVASAGLPVVYASVPSLREFLGNTATIVVSTKRSAPTSDPLAQPYRNVSSTIAMAEGVVFALLKKQGLLEQPKYLPKRAIRFLIGEGIHYLSDPASLAEFSQQPGCSPFKFPREDGKICFTQQEEIVQFFGTLKSLWVFMQDPARVAASKRAEAEYVKKTVALLKQVEEEQPSLAGMFEIVTTHELAEKSGIGRLIEKSVGSEQGQPSAWMDELESAALQVNKAGVYGDTPLYLACYNNNPGIVKLLLENGADVTVGDSGKKAIERICSSEWTTENRKKLLMSLLSVPEKGAENETEEQKKSRIFKELVVSSLAENMQQSSTIAPTISSNDGLRKYTGIANPEQVINQIETVVKFYLFTPFATVAKKSAHLWPVVIGSNSTMGIEKLVFRLSLRQLKAEFGITHEHLMFLRNLQKSASRVVVICGKRKRDGKIVIPAKTMRKLCDLWFKFEYNNQ